MTVLETDVFYFHSFEQSFNASVEAGADVIFSPSLAIFCKRGRMREVQQNMHNIPESEDLSILMHHKRSQYSDAYVKRVHITGFFSPNLVVCDCLLSTNTRPPCLRWVPKSEDLTIIRLCLPSGGCRECKL
jgi:hypothetical protein